MLGPAAAIVSVEGRGRPVVTSHDVARLAGVSQPTVSRVILLEVGSSRAMKPARKPK
jgi:hypothetical protein